MNAVNSNPALTPLFVAVGAGMAGAGWLVPHSFLCHYRFLLYALSMSMFVVARGLHFDLIENVGKLPNELRSAGVARRRRRRSQ